MNKTRQEHDRLARRISEILGEMRLLNERLDDLRTELHINERNILKIFANALDEVKQEENE